MLYVGSEEYERVRFAYRKSGLQKKKKSHNFPYQSPHPCKCYLKSRKEISEALSSGSELIWEVRMEQVKCSTLKSEKKQNKMLNLKICE